MNPNSQEALCARLIIALDQQDHTESNWRAFCELVDKHPEDPLLLWMIAVQCRELKKHTEGAFYYERLAKHFSVGPAMFHQTYANILTEGLQQHEKALEHRRLAVRLEPAGYTYQGLGNTLASMGRYDEANDIYQRSVTLEPYVNAYWRSWAWALRRAGRMEEALEKYGRAVKLSPKDEESWMGMGACYSGLDKYRDAVNCYEKAAELGNTDAMYELGKAFTAVNWGVTDYSQAAYWFHRAAAHGHKGGFFGLATLYLSGNGVPRNNVRAFYWMIRAAAQGDELSTTTLTTNFREKDRDRVEEAAEEVIARLGDSDGSIKRLLARIKSSAPPPEPAATIDISRLGPPEEILEIRRPADLGPGRFECLAPLSPCTNLVRLVLHSQRVSDLTPLTSLRQLRHLDVTDNYLTNVSPLTHLRNLDHLYLAKNKLADIAPLAYVSELCHLDISDNPITDVSPLKNLQHLESLSSGHNPVLNLSSLSTLQHLRRLTLQSSNVRSLEFLVRMVGLQDLNLSGNAISDVRYLSGLTNLVSVNLSMNRIPDIGPLLENAQSGGFARKRSPRIWLGTNPLSEFARTNQIPTLRHKYGVTVLE